MANPEETTIDEFVPDEVETAAYNVLSLLLPELTIIYESQNHQSPALPYATLQILARNEVGGITSGPVNDDGIQTFHQVIEGSLSLKCFGGMARRHLDNVRLRTKKPTSRDIMTREKFIIYDTEQVLDVGAMRAEIYHEQTSVLDMRFRYTSRFTDDVGIIEHVNLDGTIQDVPVSFEIEIINHGA